VSIENIQDVYAAFPTLFDRVLEHHPAADDVLSFNQTDNTNQQEDRDDHQGNN